MHENYSLRQEQLNKSSLLFSKAFLEDLLELFNVHVVSILVYVYGVLLSKSFCQFFFPFNFSTKNT